MRTVIPTCRFCGVRVEQFGELCDGCDAEFVDEYFAGRVEDYVSQAVVEAEWAGVELEERNK